MIETHSESIDDNKPEKIFINLGFTEGLFQVVFGVVKGIAATAVLFIFIAPVLAALIYFEIF